MEEKDILYLLKYNYTSFYIDYIDQIYNLTQIYKSTTEVVATPLCALYQFTISNWKYIINACNRNSSIFLHDKNIEILKLVI